ncbi:MAG: succinylglutamate desuccinylase/aspartoacylase family protein [Bacteroidota bacterium]
MEASLPNRIIGDFQRGTEGPLLFVLAGLHGNEPAGVYALRRVFKRLEEEEIPFLGRFLGLCGNCKALALQERYIDRDLNRLWSSEEIARIKALPADQLNSEEAELLEILALIDPAMSSSYSPQIYVDLHTTSGEGGIFSIVTEGERIRRLAESLFAPVVFNLVDELALTTSRFFEENGLVGLAFESGQHDNPKAIDNHEAAIWILLAEAGCIQPEEVPNFAQYPQRLKSATQKLDRFLKVIYRHPIEASDAFVMEPGYENFQAVSSGERLAHDHEGEILCPADGQILMPLYQKQGEDGFFIMKTLDTPPF